jgi:hypothetical protein
MPGCRVKGIMRETTSSLRSCRTCTSGHGGGRRRSTTARPESQPSQSESSCRFLTQKELDPDAVAFNSQNNRYHFPARFYLPFRGVFAQLDPLVVLPPNLSSLNTIRTGKQLAPDFRAFTSGQKRYHFPDRFRRNGYRYAISNPIRFTDSMGLQEDPPWPEVGSVSAGFVKGDNEFRKILEDLKKINGRASCDNCYWVCTQESGEGEDFDPYELKPADTLAAAKLFCATTEYLGGCPIPISCGDEVTGLYIRRRRLGEWGWYTQFYTEGTSYRCMQYKCTCESKGTKGEPPPLPPTAIRTAIGELIADLIAELIGHFLNH